MQQSDTVTATVRIAAAPEEVFPYFVEPDLLVQWLAAGADLGPEPGGVFALDMGATQVRGQYVAIEPPNRVVFTWGVQGSASLPPGSSTVEILLRAEGEETVVDLFHSDLPAEERSRHKAGWTERLAKLPRAVPA